MVTDHGLQPGCIAGGIRDKRARAVVLAVVVIWQRIREKIRSKSKFHGGQSLPNFFYPLVCFRLFILIALYNYPSEVLRYTSALVIIIIMSMCNQMVTSEIRE